MKKKKFYFLGIGGIAMANLAALLTERGFHVTGADNGIFEPSKSILESAKIKYFNTYAADNIITAKPDIIVIGNAIGRGNEELEYILNTGLPYVSMPEAIHDELLLNKRSIVITGTSGKTTTTALVAWILHQAGLAPTALVGGLMQNTQSGFFNGQGDYVVLEGDEYNSSFYDTCPKFLHYRPYIGVINNIAADHLEVYGSLENIIKAFRRFIGLIPSQGLLIANAGNANVVALTGQARSRVVMFGHSKGLTTKNLKITASGMSFVVYQNHKKLGLIKTRLLGQHNRDNTLAAIAVALEVGVSFTKIARAIATFRGVARRIDIVYESKYLMVIDDFAHNPEKVMASLNAVRQHFPRHQLIAVFEPRTGSSRRAFFQEIYPQAFKAADYVLIAQPFKKELLSPTDIFSSEQLVADLHKLKIKAQTLETTEAIYQQCTQLITSSLKNKKPTIIITMSSGQFDNLAARLAQYTRKENK